MKDANDISILPSRIRAKIDVTPDECWNWKGRIERTGYAHIKWQGRTQVAHRVVYQLLVGAIPDKMDVHHTCKNRKCCNPDHLLVLDRRSHLMSDDTLARRNAEKTHCIRDHAFTPENTLIDHRGMRQCAECQKIRTARKIEKRRQQPKDLKGHHNGRKTHCKEGHPFDSSNTFIDAHGYRQCLICNRRRAREYQAKKRAQAKFNA